MTTLRPYQATALDQLKVWWEDKRAPNAIVCAPTGAGKTELGAAFFAWLESREISRLWVAHRRELIAQAKARLPTSTEVLSVQCLMGREPETFGCVAVDEAHRTAAKSYEHAFSRGARAVGFTATPKRLDNRALDRFGMIIHVGTPRSLVRDGWLVEPQIWGTPHEIQREGLRKIGGDFSRDDLDRAAMARGLVGDVCATLARHRVPGERAVIFASSIRHSEEIVSTLVGTGVRAAHLDGKTKTKDRDHILDRFRNGELEVVSNVEILTEGWDLPSLGIVVLARPTASIALYLQMCGRVLRPHPGKTRALILDHAGNVLEHGWPTADRKWDFSKYSGSSALSEPGLIRCRECLAIYAMAATCPLCGCTDRSARVRKEKAQMEADLEALLEESVRQNAERLELRRQLARHVNRYAFKSHISHGRAWKMVSALKGRTVENCDKHTLESAIEEVASWIK